MNFREEFVRALTTNLAWYQKGGWGRGKPVSHCGWSRTILLCDVPIFQLAIDTIITVSLIKRCFFLLLPTREKSDSSTCKLAQTWKLPLFPPVGFVCLKDVTWMARYTLLTLLSGCWMQTVFWFLVAHLCVGALNIIWSTALMFLYSFWTLYCSPKGNSRSLQKQ